MERSPRKKSTGELCPVQIVLWSGLLVVIVIVSYLPAAKAGYIWDDDYYVTENKLISAPDGLRRIWFSQDCPSQYFPLTYTTFRLEYSLWKMNPTGYHITNIILHAINALLVWLLLRQLSIPGAWFAAAIFALHPVNVESVAWITERKNLLMAFFCLLSLLCWLEFANRSNKERNAWQFYGLSLALYILALFSKTTACTLPAALVLLLWFRHIPLTTKRWLQVTPYVLLGLAMGIFVVWWERDHQGSSLLVLGLNFVERILLASRALWFYLGKLFWPAKLAFSYPQWEINWAEPVQYTWLAACIISVFCLWYWRSKLGRGTIAAFAFFAATLFPMLGFFSLYTFLYTYVADHYQYFACIGPIAVFAAMGYHTLTKSGRWGGDTARVVATLILVILGTLTWQQSSVYKDSETLWSNTLSKNPGSWLANNNIGIELESQGKIDEAMAHYRQALRISPSNPEVNCNIATILHSQGKFDESVQYYRRALKDRNPRDNAKVYADAHNNLGLLLVKQGADDKAVKHFAEAIRIRPAHYEAHSNLGVALAKQGKFDKAIKHLTKALQINPELDKIHKLRQQLLRKESINTTIRNYRRLLQNQPNDADTHDKLGQALLLNGQKQQAAIYFAEAIRLKPDCISALNNLAWLSATSREAGLRNPDRAVECSERACELTDYKNPGLLDTLAVAYASAGRFTKAVDTAEKAIRTGEKNLVKEIQKRLILYQAGQPYYQD